MTGSTFRTIFEQSPISTQIFSPDGKSLKVNKAWEKLWGVKPGELGDFNILKDKQLQKSKMLSMIKAGFAGKVVRVPVHKYDPKIAVASSSAQIRWVQSYIYPIKDEEGKVVQVVMQHEDMTEQKESESKLRESETKFRQLFDSSIIGVFISDFEGKFLDGNDAFLRIIGYSRDELFGGEIKRDDLTPPEYREVSQEAVEDLKRTGSSQTYEKEYVNKNGRRVPVLIAVTRIGESQTCIGFVVDITERKQIERQKDEFISIASHELKTPITTIKSYTQILQQNLRRQKKPLLYLSKMGYQVERLTLLINDLLDVSRIQAGKLELQKEKFSLDEMIKDISDDMAQIDIRHKVIIEGKIGEKVFADKYRLNQVLVNLISNAIKYSPRADKVIVRVLVRGKEVEIKIQDFGIGISRLDQPRIFDRFFQARNRIRQSYSGLGLGLYISAEIIRTHKGRISVESEKGKGSTFSIVLPITS